jgi:DNA ligase D-like protein (predicted ligase)
MLATLTESYFSDPNWIFERKLDGERVVTYITDGEPRLYSRNRIVLNPNYPELVDALADAPDAVVDGEVVTFDHGQTSFAKLQPRMQTRNEADARRSKVPVFYYLFDMLSFDGHDIRSLAVRERKNVLRRAISFRDPIRFMTHRVRDGEAYRDEACRKGWEGVIAKRAAAPYVSGRSRDWLKFKCVRDQEFVIGGFTDPQGSRTGFGALLVGYYDDGSLRYAGKVGTGYNAQVLHDLRARLGRLEQDASPFADRVREKGSHWVRPQLVAQIGFTEWTRDGKLRHPRFAGLRRDKKAADVVRES